MPPSQAADSQDSGAPDAERPSGPRGRTTSNLALLIPTASCMAYANERGSFDTPVELLSGIVPALKPEDLFINERRDHARPRFPWGFQGEVVARGLRDKRRRLCSKFGIRVE